jgi:hypothetical protein
MVLAQAMNALKGFQAVVTVLLVASPAFGETISVVGTKLIVVDRMATASKAKVVFVSKDPHVQKAIGFANPIDAQLDIAYDAVSGSLVMAAGLEWIVNESDVAKYVNKEAPVGGTVKSSTIKRDLLLKVVGAALGDDPIDISQAPSGPVWVAHTLHDGVYTYRHCTQFAGCAHQQIGNGTGYKLVCRGGSLGDPSCVAAPPTTTTTLPTCPVPPAAPWTCCQGSSFTSCSAEYRTTGDAATFCASFGGTATPGRCGAPACAAQGCCIDAFNPGIGACADLGLDGTADEAASAAALCTSFGGAWSAASCP